MRSGLGVWCAPVEHFANRAELVLAIADEVRDQLLAAMVQARGCSPDAPE
ncbi:hypothetical protein [Nocardia sp. NBC_00403]